MERMTIRQADGRATSDDMQAALARLAQYEDLHESILREQQHVNEKMETLRAQGKNKTVTFQQLFADKLTLVGILSRFQTYGL